MLEQFESLVTELKQGANIDLIGELVGKNLINSVLTIDNNYLNDPSLSDIADGEFTVFGKVIKVLPENSEDNISLLRKTSLSKLNEALFNQIFSGFQNLDNDGITSTKFIKEIESPAIQVIPISIFTKKKLFTTKKPKRNADFGAKPKGLCIFMKMLNLMNFALNK